jgi:hypothetical protein
MQSDRKVAVYPCCGSDFRRTLFILRKYVDHVIFCDIDPKRSDAFDLFKIKKHFPRIPTCEFYLGDAIECLHGLKKLDVLYYKGDGVGEGGSGLFILGDRILEWLVPKMPSDGLIITDGSNSRGSNFERMIRPSGLNKFGRHFSIVEIIDGLSVIAAIPNTDDLARR